VWHFFCLSFRSFPLSSSKSKLVLCGLEKTVGFAAFSWSEVTTLFSPWHSWNRQATFSYTVFTFVCPVIKSGSMLYCFLS
jgi:hypothetical protein